MATRQYNFKAYVRLDGSGRTVPSSLVLRKSKPKMGKWVEVTAYECCTNTTTTTQTTALAPVCVTYRVIVNRTIALYYTDCLGDPQGPEELAPGTYYYCAYSGTLYYTGDAEATIVAYDCLN